MIGLKKKLGDSCVGCTGIKAVSKDEYKLLYLCRALDAPVGEQFKKYDACGVLLGDKAKSTKVVENCPLIEKT